MGPPPTDSEELCTPPVRVRAPLGIGVTGHRLHRLGEGRVERVRAAADIVLATIAAATNGDGVRLVTALADGADTILGQQAVARSWQLDIVLPFTRETYATDFTTGETRGDYESLLEAAHSAFELEEARGDDEREAAAYERAGRIVLDQAEILIAVWDRSPVRGRGGAAQIVSEAVLRGIPVIHIDPTSDAKPTLLWGGIEERDLGQQTVETVPRAGLEALPELLRLLMGEPQISGECRQLALFEGKPKRSFPGLAYPLLLALVGVRRLRKSDFITPDEARSAQTLQAICDGGMADDGRFARRISLLLGPRFGRADATATRYAQLFRSGYVLNFSLAALAVVLSLLGLIVPSYVMPMMIVAELGTISAILILTRTARRRGWHRRWLDNRLLAEQLRCLSVACQLGDLRLGYSADEQGSWVAWTIRSTARALGLPSACVGPVYLECCRTTLVRLIDDQMSYLKVDGGRMHRLEHRLHRLGGALFVTTALICVVHFLVEVADEMGLHFAHDDYAAPFLAVATIASAALPAIGAAIYGIRMQGDFSGSAERSDGLHAHLKTLRDVIEEDHLDFDTLRRRVRRLADLLTRGVATWKETYHARPLSLPG